MHWKQEIESLAYALENHVYFCLDSIPPQIQRRQKDMRDVVVFRLPPFKGKFDNENDVDEFDRLNDISYREGEARREKKMCVLVVPNLRTAQIAYAIMRDWCPTGAAFIELSFNGANLVPLIEKPRH